MTHRETDEPGDDTVMVARAAVVGKSGKQTVACDRCRGQKLKCVRNGGPQCRRCQRANVECIVPSPKPMGRPPRQYRSPRQYRANTSSSLGSSSNDNFLTWGDDLPAVTLPMTTLQTDNETVMDLTASDPAVDPTEMFNFFTSTDALSDLFAPGGPTFTATTLTMSNGIVHNAANGVVDGTTGKLGNSALNNIRPFSPTTEAFATIPYLGYGFVEKSSNVTPMDVVEERRGHVERHLSTDNMPPNEVSILTQLAELNVAISQHPLHRWRDKSPVQKLSKPERMINPSPVANRSADPLSSIDLSIADMGLGQLLALTAKLKDLVNSLRAFEEDESSNKGDAQKRSLAILALSCYTNLDFLFTRGLELLHQVRSGSRRFSSAWSLMAGLSIDGFNLGGCQKVQLTLLIHLYEHIHGLIRDCIRAGEKAVSTIDHN